MRQNRQAVATHTPVARKKRPYDTLQSTQQWKRRKLARTAVEEVLQQVGCPLKAIHPPSTPAPAELLHLTTAERERSRTVPSLHISCEQTMIKCKQQLATSHATETGTFAGGAFITDPVRFVSVMCAQSPFIAVGGDAGGGRCVLGVTYSAAGKQHFADALIEHSQSVLAPPAFELRSTSVAELLRSLFSACVACPNQLQE